MQSDVPSAFRSIFDRFLALGMCKILKTCGPDLSFMKSLTPFSGFGGSLGAIAGSTVGGAVGGPVGAQIGSQVGGEIG